jgi:hypothetical protein
VIGGLRLSLVVPTRADSPELRARLFAVRDRLGWDELVTAVPADPGQAPGDVRTETDTVSVVAAVKGRGTQCNAGARVARGDLLLFLHDDSLPPANAHRLLEEAFVRGEARTACFRLRFDEYHWLLGLSAWLTRFDSLWTSFGDQGIAIRRDQFTALGGFPEWPIFEDVELLRRARRHGGVHKLAGEMITSAVRYRENGVIRQQLLNAWLILRFLTGLPAERIAAIYERHTP